MWRPIPTSLLGGASYPSAAERSLYTLYGGLFGLSNSNLVFPTLGLHPFMNAGNLNGVRLREGMPATSMYNTDNSTSSQLHYPTAIYRYHPYLNPEKLAAAQKSNTPTSESSTTVDPARQ